MSAGNRVLIFPVPTIFILLIVFACNTPCGHRSNPAPSCPPSTCGNIAEIKSPFRLKTDSSSCGYNNTNFQLDCLNNRTTVLTANSSLYSKYSRRYFVKKINYKDHRISLVDPGINEKNLLSCPVNDDWNLFHFGFTQFDALSKYKPMNAPVAFIHCLFSVNSTQYVKASFCGKTSNIFGNSSQFYSYVMVGDPDLLVSDLEESCTMDKLGWISTHGPMMDKSSLTSIYNGLAYGFELSYIPKHCKRAIQYNLAPYAILWADCCFEEPYWCTLHVKLPMSIALKCVWTVGEILIIRLVIGFVIGFPLLLWLVAHKWQRRHLSMDKTIEKFLQDQHNLVPLKYTYLDIKQMTNNFNQRLGEGGYGTVYKGKLRSGFFVAVKMLDQSMASEEEFISEVGTIGRIHHVNVVQLIGFCIERSKYALVYEFLPNGSLDRYIFNQQSLEAPALTFDKMFEIALGVAHGIGYLHHGCEMQILHFDIKPHNILLDEKFNPKISDFGLARLHPINESFINLTAARGTVGYMAPEMFYKNIGGISYKVDVYSFGMMLMEMAGRRRNINHLVEDINQMYFPSWVYDQLCAKKDIEIKDATEEERKLMKNIMIVALWCIRMKPSNRPSMNKVIEMLEGEFEPQLPAKPFGAPRETTVSDHEITQTYSVECINIT